MHNVDRRRVVVDINYKVNKIIRTIIGIFSDSIGAFNTCTHVMDTNEPLFPFITLCIL